MKVLCASVVMVLISAGLVQAENEIPKSLYGYWEVNPKRAMEVTEANSELTSKELEQRKTLLRGLFTHGDESWVEITKDEIVLGSHTRWGSPGSGAVSIHVSTIYKYGVKSVSKNSATVMLTFAAQINNGQKIDHPKGLPAGTVDAEKKLVIRLVDGKWMSMESDNPQQDLGPAFHRVSDRKSADKGLIHQ